MIYHKEISTVVGNHSDSFLHVDVFCVTVIVERNCND